MFTFSDKARAHTVGCWKVWEENEGSLLKRQGKRGTWRERSAFETA